MLYLREIWHFKPKKLLHQGIVNGSIANFFVILLRYNSKHRIVLFTILQKKKKILLLLFPLKFLSHPFHFFCSLLSLPSLFLHLLSPLWSFIAEISHPFHTASLLSLITRPLSHRTGAGFWIFEVGVGSAWIDELGLDRWARIG